MTNEHNQQLAKKYLNTGLVHSKKGEHIPAIANYTKAIGLNPDLFEAYHHRGNAYLTIGELNKAISDFTEMLVQRPKIPESYYIRGEAYLHAGKWEEAKRDLTAAILQRVDIAKAFQNKHGVITAFEEKIGTKFPEDIVHLLNSTPEFFVIDKDARIALGMKYYENRELSSGLASRLADIPRGKFILLMGNYGLSPFGTAEELRESGF